jgi:hypothetical protein
MQVGQFERARAHTHTHTHTHTHNTHTFSLTHMFMCGAIGSFSAVVAFRPLNLLPSSYPAAGGPGSHGEPSPGTPSRRPYPPSKGLPPLGPSSPAGSARASGNQKKANATSDYGERRGGEG